MTFNIYSLTFTFLFIISFSSCNLIEDDPQNNSAELPPITMTGENTFGCLIDSEVFLPSGSLIGVPFGTGINPLVSYEEASGSFKVFASNSQSRYKFTLKVSQSLNEPGIYEFTASSNYTNLDLENCGRKYFVIIEKSQLNLTKLDTEQNIASGTFYGEFFDSCNDTIIVSDGRFDAEYIL